MGGLAGLAVARSEARHPSETAACGPDSDAAAGQATMFGRSSR